MYSLTDICFLCLVHTKSLTSTLSEDEDGIVLEEKLKCFLMEYVHFKPEMIKYVCTTCFGNVNNLYSFRQQSLRNMTTLNDYFDKLVIEAPPYKHFLEVKPDNQTIPKDSSMEIETKHELKCEELDIEESYPPNEDSIQHKPLEVNIVVKSEPQDSFEDEFINDDTIENFELSEDNGGDEDFVNESENFHLQIRKNVPANTTRSKRSIWTQFEMFCEERKYDIVNELASIDTLCTVLKDWRYNMKKRDGTNYKDGVVKVMWNSVAKQIQILYSEKFNVKFDPFTDEEFKTARARTNTRKMLTPTEVPVNTIRSRRSIWNQFEVFCREKKYDIVTTPASVDILNNVLKDWGFNMKKKNGTNYKEGVVKIMWNSVAKQIQEIYTERFNMNIDLFTHAEFKIARDGRDYKRKILKTDDQFRKKSAVVLTVSDYIQIINMFDENTPDGLQKKFYHIAARNLSWSTKEGTYCLISYFQEEFDAQGQSTCRIQYNPDATKIVLRGSYRDKWLEPNTENVDICPVRLLKKLLSKRGKNINITRLFLTPHPAWTQDKLNSLWFKNSPIGRNVIAQWTRKAAAQIGIDTNAMKITTSSLKF